MNKTTKPVPPLPVRSNAGLERKLFEDWSRDGRRLGDMELLFAWEAWKASANIEREACVELCKEVAKQAVNNSQEYQTGREMGAMICANKIRLRSNV